MKSLLSQKWQAHREHSLQLAPFLMPVDVQLQAILMAVPGVHDFLGHIPLSYKTMNLANILTLDDSGEACTYSM